MNGERAALTQIDFVRIHREDLFFGEAQLEDNGDERFRNLAPPRRFGRQKKVSCKLLRDRAAALQSMSLVKIRDECAGDSDRIQPMMSEEILIFTRRHRIHEHLRYVLEFNQAAFRARCVGKVRHQLWRSRINLRGVLENLPAQFEVNNPRVSVVVVSNNCT